MRFLIYLLMFIDPAMTLLASETDNPNCDYQEMKIESEFRNYSISADGQFRAYFENVDGVAYIQIEVYRNNEWIKSYRFESPILASRLVWPEEKIWKEKKILELWNVNEEINDCIVGAESKDKRFGAFRKNPRNSMVKNDNVQCDEYDNIKSEWKYVTTLFFERCSKEFAIVYADDSYLYKYCFSDSNIDKDHSNKLPWYKPLYEEGFGLVCFSRGDSSREVTWILQTNGVRNRRKLWYFGHYVYLK